MAIKNSEKAVKKTTNKITKTADDSGTRSLDTKEYRKKQQNPLDIEYVNEMHVEDFVKALQYDPVNGPSTSDAEYISAWSDALPSISNSTRSTNKAKKSSKRKLQEQEAAKPKGISHSLMQYPLIVSFSLLLTTN
jgi:hypothetical protein